MEGTMLLEGKAAIVTGAGSGIGNGIARRFAQEGCKVALVDINQEAAERAAGDIAQSGGRAVAIACDITVERNVRAAVEKAMAAFGTVDIMVNNAGGAGVSYPIEELPEEVWDRTQALNLKSQYFFCKYIVPVMKAKRYGKIVNLSSIGAIQPPAHHIAYNTAKAAIIGFTYDLATALAPFGINVNAIVPGPVRTSFYDRTTGAMTDGEKDDFFAALGRKTPMQRPGSPDDLAGAALFLVSELGAYVTGHALYVTGGLPLLPPPAPPR
jgi:NAD(P)-dependent dehydrogenase (short-subunit alcohol dehydrogenase family)